VLDSLHAVGGTYVAMFVVALISGVFPLVNSEITLGVLAMNIDSLPESLALAAIVAVGQTITHSTLFLSARGVTELGAKRRHTFEARIARARAIVERWRDRWMLLLFAAATLGLPPMMLVSVAAGAFGFRFRTFVIVGLIGRVIRFGSIAVVAQFI
jgi:membrane protein YqaA with SNARE-associated domain